MLPTIQTMTGWRSLVGMGRGGSNAGARNDPSAFVAACCTDACERPLKQSRVHVDLQAFLSRHDRALIEMPRDHGKSMQVCGRILWELGRNPALRIKIVCATERIADERGRFLRQALERNERLRRIFPELRPGAPWGETRFSVARPANIIGPSVTALGLGAGLTGTRADLLVCDDIVDVRSLVSAVERARSKTYFRDNLMNLLEPDGRCWCLFTPWHPNDLNAELKHSGAFALFRRAVPADLTPVWPEHWTRERLQARRDEIGSASFARGYHLLPSTDDVVQIRSDWVKFWAADQDVHKLGGRWRRVVLAIDPAVSTRPGADASGLVVLVAGEEPRVYCVEALARRVSAPDLVHLIGAVDQRWNPEEIVFESNAAFQGFKDLLARHPAFGHKIRGVQQTKSKAVRIAALSVRVEDGSFLLKGTGNVVDPAQRQLFEEMTTFPAGPHDDLVDAAAMGVEYLIGKPEIRVW